MFADFSGSEPDTALMEEREALNIQRKMAEQLRDEDFGLDIFKASSGSSSWSRTTSGHMIVVLHSVHSVARWPHRYSRQAVPVRQIYYKYCSYLLKYLCCSVIKVCNNAYMFCDVQLEITMQYTRLKAVFSQVCNGL